MNLPSTNISGDPMALSAAVAKSGIAGAKTPEAAFTLACMALAEDKDASSNPMAFMAALGRASTSYHLINGRPVMKAETMLARFQQSGGTVNWSEYSDKRAEGTFSHPAGGTLTLDWTIDRAKAAGLVKAGSPWMSHPRAMLRSRVTVEAIRTVFPAVLNGAVEPDEAREIDRGARPVDVAPHRDPKADAITAYNELAASDKATADRLLAQANKNPDTFLALVEDHKKTTTPPAEQAQPNDDAPVVIEDIPHV
jgi:hypothetical protein